jgi:hypothetical protein
MRRRALLGLAAGTVLVARPLQAQATVAPPAEVAQALPRVRLQGQGRMRFLGLLVYDVRLWAADTLLVERWEDTPLALELSYARALAGPAIAERSLTEMQRQGPIVPAQAEHWLAGMTRLFPDVRDGDRLTGVYRPGSAATFFFNGQARGELVDAEFARRFFGIWLAPQTSEPGLRERLLGIGR